MNKLRERYTDPKLWKSILISLSGVIVLGIVMGGFLRRSEDYGLCAFCALFDLAKYPAIFLAFFLITRFLLGLIAGENLVIAILRSFRDLILIILALVIVFVAIFIFFKAYSF